MDLENCVERELFSAIERLVEYMDKQLMSGLYTEEQMPAVDAANARLTRTLTEEVIEQVRYKKADEAAAQAQLRDARHIMETSISSRPLSYRVLYCTD